jgi:hypothetical protein
MKTGNYKEVYITRDTNTIMVDIWNPNIGIAKFQGCVEFASASTLSGTGVMAFKARHGRLDSVSCTKLERALSFIPSEETAWLYNTTTGKRTRVDKDMALIDPDTGKVIG